MLKFTDSSMNIVNKKNLDLEKEIVKLKQRIHEMKREVISLHIERKSDREKIECRNNTIKNLRNR